MANKPGNSSFPRAAGRLTDTASRWVDGRRCSIAATDAERFSAEASRVDFQHISDTAMADAIEDTSTELIIVLGIQDGMYAANQDYRAWLAAYLEKHRSQITPAVLDGIGIPELRDVVRSILDEMDAATNPGQERRKT